jgi:bacillithiol biosynthesis deacetylase BshB1
MDCVVFGAHPDDAEIFAGGLLALCVKRGYDVGVVHLTQGERATRGTVAERRAEAAEASEILGLKPNRTLILDLGDTLIENNEQNRLEIVRILRNWQPRIVLHHYPMVDRHPDHAKAGRLLEEAYSCSRLAGVQTDQPPFAPTARYMFFYTGLDVVSPSFVVDITETFERKVEALRAYRSQFYNPDYPGQETYISSREFFEQIEVRARFFGGLINVRYGEPYWAPGPLSVADPVADLSDRRS